MMTYRTRVRSLLPLFFALMALSAGPAAAQDFLAPEAKPARRVKLDRVCRASLERFCPELEATPGQTRNQVICLKPYRADLTLPCRSAVTAAMR